MKLRPLTAEEMEAIHQKKYLPMASKLRFIPKVTGLRPIVRMSGVVEAQTLSKESRAKKVFIFLIFLCGFVRCELVFVLSLI